MSDRDEVPLPPDTGQDGTQVTTEQAPGALAETPFPASPLIHQLQGLLTVNPDAMGSEAISRMILGSMHTSHVQLHDALAEIKSLRSQLDSQRISNGQLAEKFARSDEKLVAQMQLADMEKGRRLNREIAITVGTALLGFAIERVSAGAVWMGVALAALGMGSLYSGLSSGRVWSKK